MYFQRGANLSLLIFLFTFLDSIQAKKLGALMTKIECLNYLPEKIKNFNCWVNRTSKITGTFSVEISFTEDVIDATGNYTISVKRGSSITKYLSVHVDYCKVLRSVQSNYAFKMILTEIRRSTNLPLECPFKMNKLYYIKDFAVDTKVFPSYVPEVDFITSTQLNNYKKHVGQVNIHGRLARA